MIEILLVCYLTTAPFKPVEGWTITEINNRQFSAAVTLKKSVSQGDVIVPPVGCRLDEPKDGPSSIIIPSFRYPGGWFSY